MQVEEALQREAIVLYTLHVQLRDRRLLMKHTQQHALQIGHASREALSREAIVLYALHTRIELAACCPGVMTPMCFATSDTGNNSNSVKPLTVRPAHTHDACSQVSDHNHHVFHKRARKPCSVRLLFLCLALMREDCGLQTTYNSHMLYSWGVQVQEALQ